MAAFWACLLLPAALLAAVGANLRAPAITKVPAEAWMTTVSA